MMKKYHDAILDNQLDEAAKIMAEIRTADATAIAQQTAARIREEMRQEARATALDSVIAELESTHDVLNVNSAGYDPDVTQEVLDLHSLYVTRGYTPADAMRRAAGMVLRTATPVVAAPAAAVVTAPATAVPTTAELVAAQRAAHARTQAAAVAAQPTAVPARAEMSPATTIDILTLSDEEFAALPDSKLREMRGDFALGRF
jgi:hypothetical protein